MLDCGATGNFINSTFASKYNIPLVRKARPIPLFVIDGTPISSGGITHSSVPLLLQFSTPIRHEETSTFEIIPMNFPVILGLPWLQKHNPQVSWDTFSLRFDSAFCKKHCLTYQKVAVASNLDSSLSKDTQLSSTLASLSKDKRLSSNLDSSLSKDKQLSSNLASLSKDKRLSSNLNPLPWNTVLPPTPPSTPALPQSPALPSDLHLNFDSPSHLDPLDYLTSPCELQASISELQTLELEDPTAPAEQLQHSLLAALEDSNTYEGDLLETTSKENPIPPEYERFRDLFDKAKADVLPEHSKYDHSIPLVEGSTPPYGPIYGLSELELKTLRDQLDKDLARGFIRPSTSPAGAPVLFVKKKDGSLRLCIDYRGLNNITIKNRHPLPLIPELFDRLRSAKIYTKLDLRGAYNLVRIAEGEEWKTAFRTRYGHFEYCVMPFGLSNAPASFQALMNDTLRPFLDIFVVVYLDDILIYSTNELEHRTHVTKVLEKLSEANLFVKLEKCEFHVSKVDFLGYVIEPSGISMSPDKVSSITTWPRPASIKDIQAFLGFCNYYRIFIEEYSKLASGMLKLLKKDTPFIWGTDQEASFTSLKEQFITGKVLQHFDPSKPSVLYTDASDKAISGIIYQKNDRDRLQPIAFYSRTLTSAEQNYDIFNKELLAIVASLRNWRIYLEGAAHQVTCFTDHSNLVPFTTSKELNRRQARWYELLGSYDFVIKHIPGSTNSKADALSRRPDYMSTEFSKMSPPLIRPSQLIAASRLSTSTEELEDDFLEDDLLEATEDQEKVPLLDHIRTSLLEDPWTKKVVATLKETLLDPSKQKPLNLAHFELNSQELLLFNKLIVVPSNRELRLRILRIYHDDLTAGHFGISKTFEAVSRIFYWSKLRQFVDDYVRTCEKCAINKNSYHKPYGELQPLPIPLQPWSSISMDFIVKLPLSASELFEDLFDSILVVVDRLTKMAHFIPCKESMNSKQLALLLLKYVFRLHGLPLDIVSDRGSLFTSNFFRELTRLLRIRQKMSTAFHPQTDGQTEKTNSTLEQYLRMFVNYEQDNWVDLLPFAEFAYNSSISTSSKESPFYANFGFQPLWHFQEGFASNNPIIEDRALYLRTLHSYLRNELLRAQDAQALAFDRRIEAAPPIKIGDMVWLNRRNIKTTRPSIKLDSRKLGPFEVTRQASKNAFELKLPGSMKIHNVFHVNLLEKVTVNPLRPTAPRPQPVVLEDSPEEEFEVEAIRKHKNTSKGLYYLVKWKGFPDFESTWQSEADLEHAKAILTRYKTKHKLPLRKS